MAQAPTTQDKLEEWAKDKEPLSIYLVNGVKLRGTISWIDPISFWFVRGTSGQLVNRNAVATIIPQKDEAQPAMHSSR